MLRYIIVIFLCLGSSSLLGVNFRFIDATDSITPIEAVFVQNVRTNELAYSDSDGGLNIPAIPGDSLFINSFGFRNEIFIVDSVVNSILFYLIREYLLLDPVEVLGMKVKFKSHIPKSRKHRLSTSSTIGYAYLKKFNGESVKSISKVRLKADIQKVNSAVLLLFVEWESDLIPLFSEVLYFPPSDGKYTEIDITEYFVLTEGRDFYLGVEFISKEQENRIFLSDRLDDQSSYFKDSRIGQWEEMNSNFSLCSLVQSPRLDIIVSFDFIPKD